ncbi:MAG: GtrA family protein [Ferruginibacter sp.]
MKNRLKVFIDFFYPPFRRFMNVQTFRYAVCGGSNAVLGTALFAFTFHFIVREEVLDLGFYAIKPHNVALLVSFCITFVVGFLLNKYIVFTTSNLKGRIQLFRYFLSFLFNMILNYFMMRVLVEKLEIYAILAQVITTIVSVAISYLSQHHFSFKVKKAVV